MKNYELLFGTVRGKRGDLLELTDSEAALMGDLIREVKVETPEETKPETKKPAETQTAPAQGGAQAPAPVQPKPAAAKPARKKSAAK